MGKILLFVWIQLTSTEKADRECDGMRISGTTNGTTLSFVLHHHAKQGMIKDQSTGLQRQTLVFPTRQREWPMSCRGLPWSLARPSHGASGGAPLGPPAPMGARGACRVKRHGDLQLFVLQELFECGCPAGRTLAGGPPTWFSTRHTDLGVGGASS